MATNAASEAPARFSEVIRRATWSAHGDAEQAAFMSHLMAGTADAARVGTYTAQLYFVYSALDEAERVAATNVSVRTFLHAGLGRVPALVQDLQYFLGNDWRLRVAPMPVTIEYCERLHTVGNEWPAGFVAHHYTRYLGDLSGGQFIRRALASKYGWADGCGASFYAFDGIGDLDAFKIAYREHLDRAPWDDVERQRIVDEILAAYDLNTRLLATI